MEFRKAKVIILLAGAVIGVFVPVIPKGNNEILELTIVLIVSLMALMIFKAPAFGIVFLALTTAFSYSFSVGTLPEREIEIRTDDLILIFIFIALLSSWLRREGKFVLKLQSPIDYIYLILILQGLFSTFFNVLFRQLELKELFVASFYWVKYSQYLVVFILTTLLVRSKSERRYVLGALAFGVAVTICWGVVQILSDNYALRSLYSRIAMPFDTGPNVLGAYLIIVLPPFFSLTITKNLRKPERISLSILLLISMVMVFFTGSRAGVIGFIFAIVAVLLFKVLQMEIPRYVFWRLLVFLFAFVLIVLLMGEILTPLQRLLMFDRYSIFDVRIEGIWIPLVERTLSRNPILGNGIMLFDRDKAENYFVRMFSEQGLVGLGLFFLLIGVLSHITCRVSRSSDDPLIRNIATGFLGSIVGLLFASIWSDKFIVVRIMTPFWILAGLVVGSSSKLPGEIK